MVTIIRTLGAMLFALIVGPFLMAISALAAANPPPNPSTGTGTIVGNVIDNAGSPIASAQLLLEGPTAATTTSDIKGGFSFTAVAPGVYTISAVKSGYVSVTDTDITVVASSTTNLTISMVAQSLTSLRVLGREVVRGQRGTFNTAPASVNVVTTQTFADQGMLQVQRVLDQTPGIVVGHPGTSANNAAPGAITFPNIRGALSFETASLIDGHPVSVGTFGDYVTTFLNPYFFSDVEVVKGPGADAPEVNYALGGTVNFVIKNPTVQRVGDFHIGFDNQHGQFSNWAASGSFLDNNKFGYVLDYGVQDLPGPLRPFTGNTTLPSGLNVNGQDICSGSFSPTCFSTNAIVNPGVQNNAFAGSSTVIACCFSVKTTYVSKTELAKFRYKLSSATVVTASYLGSQTWTDQNGNHLQTIGTVFTPAGGYSGALTPGSTIMTEQNIFTPQGEWEVNNEPIFEADLRTTLNNDTILLRGYSASINRLQFNALNSNVDYLTAYKLSGSLKQCPPAHPFVGTNNRCGDSRSAPGGVGPAFAPVTVIYNDQTVPVTYLGAYFRQSEEDKLHGWSIEYDHPDGDNLYSLAFDTTNSSTISNQILGISPTINPGNPNITNVSITVPDGSRQVFSTLLARAIVMVKPKLTATISNYLNWYNSRYSPNAAANPTNPSVWVFQNYIYSHYDPRIGLTWRPTSDLSWRFSMGSAIAPPYLALLDSATNCDASPVSPGPPGAPTCVLRSGVYTQNLNSGNLKPETAWGYDWGGDWRLPYGSANYFSWDAYFTTVYNQFLKSSFQNPTLFNGAPLIEVTNQNLGYSRYYGVEASFKHRPARGFGYTMQGSLMRGYPFNLPPCFYSNTPNSPNCAFQFNTNLAILPGINFQTNGTSGSPSGFNAISNQSVPYSQGYGELNWRGSYGQFYQVNETYYGNNNSLNRKPFFVWGATIREPIADRFTTVQLSVDNAFSAYPSGFVAQNGGVTIPLANSRVGQTNGNVIGPAVYRLDLHRTFGYSATGQ